MSHRVYRTPRPHRPRDGHERARAHIEAAQRLSKELGGSDSQVKAFFFKLPPSQTDAILREYGRRFGAVAEDYARQTLPRWRSGNRQMSGLVAERLMGLLPPFMPMEERYSIAEAIWKATRGKTTGWIVCGPDASSPEVMKGVNEFVGPGFDSHSIPEDMRRRFRWLAEGDVRTYEQIVDHVARSYGAEAREAAEAQVPSFLKQIREQPDTTHRIEHTITVGDRSCILVFDPKARGVESRSVRPVTGRAAAKTSAPDADTFILIIIIIIVIATLIF